MENKVDLHIHTNKSDGTKTIEEVLMEAEQLGLKRIAITDHESVEAYSELNQELFSGIIIPAIELKTYCKGREIELLGYGISVEEMRKKLPTFYKSKEENSIEYLKAIVYVLRSKGIILPDNIEEQYTDFTIQPAKFITKVISNDKENLKHNAETLLSDKIKHESKESLYRGWLSNPQSEFYVAFKGYPDYTETIKLIKMCRGKVFIPHIFQYGDGSVDILEELLENGKVDGIECYYPTFTKEQTQYLLDICTSRNLFVSGGSDYHGANKKNELGKGLDNNLFVLEEKVETWTNMLLKNLEKREKLIEEDLCQE